MLKQFAIFLAITVVMILTCETAEACYNCRDNYYDYQRQYRLIEYYPAPYSVVYTVPRYVTYHYYDHPHNYRVAQPYYRTAPYYRHSSSNVYRPYYPYHYTYYPYRIHHAPYYRR